ncbi:MAG: hypothetical protein BWY81_00463 [Firmicutes bacterium ADurb.Bin467]|nr:MAG: hypothetical protein BWY81_00463 [Firmicutes bacterium ADurb.Bin467]
MQQNAADLVAVQELRLARRGQARDADAVAVRVGRDAEVGLELLLQLDREVERVALLGVRDADRRERAVRQFLLGHDVHVLDADLLEDSSNRHVSRAVQRRIDDLELLAHRARERRVHEQPLDGLDVPVVDVLADGDEKPGRARRLFVHRLRVEVADVFELLGDPVRALGRELAAVLPVDLVAVVLGRVVAGGDHDAGEAIEPPDREREHRHRAQRVEQVRPNALRREHERRLLREFPGEAAGIVADRDAALRAAVFPDQRGERERRAADRIAVHAVRPEPEHAAHAGGAERELAVEAVLELRGVFGGRAELPPGRLVPGGARKPPPVFVDVAHRLSFCRVSLLRCARSCPAISRNVPRAFSSPLMRASSA